MKKAMINYIQKEKLIFKELKKGYKDGLNKETTATEIVARKEFPVTITKEELEKRWKGVDIWI